PRARSMILSTMLALALAGVTSIPALADVDDPAPVLHHVKYSVWSDTPVTADIYYRDTDPPTFADYSHNPYQYSPNIQVDVGPDKQWVLDVMLADPDQWAMVIGTKTRAQTELGFHCVLAVDGNVVAVNSGPKGAL